MRKLWLLPEELEVESFATTPASRRSKGTVRANMPTGPLNDDPSYDCQAGGPTGCGVCVGPTYSCPETVTCPVIDATTPSRVVSAVVKDHCSC
jgi:hypothetical protein